MSTKKLLAAIVIVAAVVGLYLWAGYNRLVTMNERVGNQWAQVEAQYQRRLDLIPNLVESVKGIFEQERSIFGDLAEARTRYAGATTVSDRVAAANQVESSLGRLLVVVENYPQLKSAENVQTLMAQLEGTENRVSVERQRFNDAVRDYNLTVKRFPARLLAGLFGFSEKPYFEAAAGAEQAPQVKL